MTRDEQELLRMKGRRTVRRRARRHNRSCTVGHRCFQHRDYVNRDELYTFNLREMEKTT